MICPHRWQLNPKITADQRLSADRSAVHTSLMAGGRKAAGSQHAYKQAAAPWDRHMNRWTDRAIPKMPPRVGGGIIPDSSTAQSSALNDGYTSDYYTRLTASFPRQPG